MSGQLHAPAALLSEKKTSYPLKELLWASRILSRRCKQKKNVCPSRPITKLQDHLFVPCMRTSSSLLKICEN